jgi:hypothetical protein
MTFDLVAAYIYDNLAFRDSISNILTCVYEALHKPTPSDR